MNNNEQKIDNILDSMKKRTSPGQGWKTTEQFKADFFEKVNNSKEKKYPLFLKIFLPAAAAIMICSTMVFFKLKKTPADHQIAIPVENTAVFKSVHDTEAPVTLPKKKGRILNDPLINFSAAISCSQAFSATGSSADTGRSFRRPAFNTEEYKALTESGFTAVSMSPLSTFGADVDTAGYTNVRRYLLQWNQLPPEDAARTEEFLNYFTYNYKVPADDSDFQVDFESMDAPWSPERKLLLVGVQAKDVPKNDLPPSNFVFLIDNSGSMYKVFPMVIEAMKTLTDQLRENDRISLVTYGGGVEVLLDGGCGSDREKVKKQISMLNPDGYTPGGAGILEAYKLAHKHFIKGGNNRIILITDGDFNVGVSSESDLVAMVEKERQSAIYLSAFGVGFGNYKDSKLKMLANKGNGNYFYLDSVREAKRVMTNEMTGKMFTIARDVKFQIEFNPAKVAAYRLVGYELRKLADSDFNDDTKDSGEVGVGHQVTAVYELIMADAPSDVKKKYSGSVDPLKYQQKTANSSSADILTFKLRYKKPEGEDPSRLLTFTLKSMPGETDNIRWAAAVTEFTLLLQNSEYKGNASFNKLRIRAQKALGTDDDGKRAEFLTLVKAAEELQK